MPTQIEGTLFSVFEIQPLKNDHGLKSGPGDRDILHDSMNIRHLTGSYTIAASQETELLPPWPKYCISSTR